jgi:hypothetical protein
VCPNRRFQPVTDEVVHWHLTGSDAKDQDFVMGIYPCFWMKPAVSRGGF